jgi:hypothetical protein
LDKSIEMARNIVQTLNDGRRKQFSDLGHVAEFAAGGGELPKTLRVDGIEFGVKAIVAQCTNWPT